MCYWGQIMGTTERIYTEWKGTVNKVSVGKYLKGDYYAGRDCDDRIILKLYDIWSSNDGGY